MEFVDNIQHVITLAQAGDMFGDVHPQAPSGFQERVNRGLGFAQYLGVALAVVGVIVAGISMIIGRQRGDGDEATHMALRIGAGAAMIGSALAIVSFFV